MSSSLLFSPLRMGHHELSHRVVMAPLTRMRASRHGNAPHDLNATDYGQRASSGARFDPPGSRRRLPRSPGIDIR